MGMPQLVVTAVLVDGRSKSEVARQYGVSRRWVITLVQRYLAEGDAGLEPRSRRPLSSPQRTPPELEQEIIEIRKNLDRAGHEAGAATIAFHLHQRHGRTPAVSTIWRILVDRGLVTPQPHKRPKSSYLRFAAEQPNERWQLDITHCTLAEGSDVEILNIIDDHSRLCVGSDTLAVFKAADVEDCFRKAAASYGDPASLLSDIQAGWAASGLFVGRRGGSVSSGTRPSLLLDRVERIATSGLLTVLAGGASAGARDALLGTWRLHRVLWSPVRIPVSECLVRIVLQRWIGCRRQPCEQRSPEVILRMGIDIAIRAPHQASLANERGELIWSGHRFRTTAGDLQRLWSRLPAGTGSDEVTIVMEPTRNAWVPLAAWFRRQGAKAVLVSAERSSDLRAYYSKHTKSDRLDSVLLARLPMLHPEGLHPERGLGPGDPLRRATKLHSTLVKRRTTSLARLDALLEILGPDWHAALNADLSSKTPLRFLAAGYADPHTVTRMGRARLTRFIHRHSRGAWCEPEAEAILAAAHATSDL
jgi:transposase